MKPVATKSTDHKTLRIRRTLVAAIALLGVIMGYQNCGDIRIRGFSKDAASTTMTTVSGCTFGCGGGGGPTTSVPPTTGGEAAIGSCGQNVCISEDGGGVQAPSLESGIPFAGLCNGFSINFWDWLPIASGTPKGLFFGVPGILNACANTSLGEKYNGSGAIFEELSGRGFYANTVYESGNASLITAQEAGRPTVGTLIQRWQLAGQTYAVVSDGSELMANQAGTYIKPQIYRFDFDPTARKWITHDNGSMETVPNPGYKTTPLLIDLGTALPGGLGDNQNLLSQAVPVADKIILVKHSTDGSFTNRLYTLSGNQMTEVAVTPRTSATNASMPFVIPIQSLGDSFVGIKPIGTSDLAQAAIFKVNGNQIVQVGQFLTQPTRILFLNKLRAHPDPQTTKFTLCHNSSCTIWDFDGTTVTSLGTITGNTNYLTVKLFGDLRLEFDQPNHTIDSPTLSFRLFKGNQPLGAQTFPAYAGEVYVGGNIGNPSNRHCLPGEFSPGHPYYTGIGTCDVPTGQDLRNYRFSLVDVALGPDGQVSVFGNQGIHLRMQVAH